ncbi:hypothetical protein ES676_10805 [Bizionia saleffrena]|uniref:Uncharacterized protein n=1 Tax=Bizionia saleffrena TaxID=291189 RepID=A0A8H2LL44_9FLAO|nr:hypothetical protein [Bizionia saleffrena]TYB72655.1 hypothetical protein ES676_10805 [Bizionia saleffrena]
MKTNLTYNPFSGLLAEDINAVLVPRFNMEALISKIKQPEELLTIEFLGKQGRGKTTHLRSVHQQLKEFPIVFLNAKSSASEVLNHTKEILFIDSIHHLKIKERLQLFKQKKTIVYTTHYTRKWECLIAKKKIYSFQFNGIEPETLQLILNKRLLLATPEGLECENLFSVKDSTVLIKKFKDNYRAIINHLYETYQ